MTGLSADLKFAVRSLRRRPAFAVALTVILALASGGTTAVFRVVDRVLLDPIPIRKPAEVLLLYEASTNTPYGLTSYPTYSALASGTTVFQNAAAASMTMAVSLGAGNEAGQISIALATNNYFAELDVQPALGRVFAANDAVVAGADAVVVLSDAFWRTQFRADHAIIGRQVSIGGRLLTVIGVMPPWFRGTDLASSPQAWIPVSAAATLQLGPLFGRTPIVGPAARVKLFQVVVRLPAGVSPAVATSELSRFVEHANASEASRVGDLILVPIREAALVKTDRPGLLRVIGLLGTVVSLILLLAVVNVANLLLIRADERTAELGIRAALGASGGRLARQLLTECVVLGAVGSVLGVAVAVAMLRMASVFTLPGGIPVDRVGLGVDWRLLVFASALCVFTTLAFGMLPARRAARTQVIDALRQTGGRFRHGLGRGALLAAQVAVSIVLVAGAGLFLRSLQAGFRADLGFDPTRLAAVSVQTDVQRPLAQLIREYDAVVRELQRTPGITAAAAATHVPLGDVRALLFSAGPATESPPAGRAAAPMRMASVTPNYFETLGVPILAGRAFAASDGATADRVAIVNESAARVLWPNASAIGQKFNFLDAETFTVAGVVKDLKYVTIQDHQVPFVYVLMSPEDRRQTVAFVARSNTPALALSVIERTVRTVAPGLTPIRPRLVRDQITSALRPQRLAATLLSGFAVLALLITAAGIHGNVAYTVARRRRDLGIRIALGAVPIRVVMLVLSECAAAVMVGAIGGIVATAVGAKLVTHFLYGVAPTDWVSFAWAILTITMVAAIAVLVPATHAVRTDPVKALRSVG